MPEPTPHTPSIREVKVQNDDSKTLTYAANAVKQSVVREYGNLLAELAKTAKLTAENLDRLIATINDHHQAAVQQSTTFRMRLVSLEARQAIMLDKLNALSQAVANLDGAAAPTKRGTRGSKLQAAKQLPPPWPFAPELTTAFNKAVTDLGLEGAMKAVNTHRHYARKYQPMTKKTYGYVRDGVYYNPSDHNKLIISEDRADMVLTVLEALGYNA